MTFHEFSQISKTKWVANINGFTVLHGPTRRAGLLPPSANRGTDLPCCLYAVLNRSVRPISSASVDELRKYAEYYHVI